MHSLVCLVKSPKPQPTQQRTECCLTSHSRDLRLFQQLAYMLQVVHSFGVPCELTIVSAHRTPDRMLDYARNAHKRGIKVIIAGAGGAAHLPGMVAALTPLPTVGVPVTPVGAHLDGLDALLSIVQVRLQESLTAMTCPVCVFAGSCTLIPLGCW